MIMPRITLVLLLLSSLLIGCGSSPKKSLVVAELEIVDYPSMGEVSFAEVGSTLVSKGKLYRYDGVELLEKVSDPENGRQYVMQPHKMPLVKTDELGNKYYQPVQMQYYVVDHVFGGRLVPLSEGYFVVAPDGRASLDGYYDLTTPEDLVNPYPSMKVGKLIDEKRPNFRQELIYGGRDGDVIQITYREFAGDMLRAAFNQQAQYDLSESREIGFRGVRIEVIETSNTGIRYIVRKSFPATN